jgi:hypothetical protein
MALSSTPLFMWKLQNFEICNFIAYYTKTMLLFCHLFCKFIIVMLKAIQEISAGEWRDYIISWFQSFPYFWKYTWRSRSIMVKIQDQMQIYQVQDMTHFNRPTRGQEQIHLNRSIRGEDLIHLICQLGVHDLMHFYRSIRGQDHIHFKRSIRGQG